ncbi:myogenesis-regulating glycosidase-like isoform X2 [Aricia agestis]|uniref:myogenesis-regulating glycosidase-like isoform X2 n=1 Tax=Aricia agestis TaxID=91739 RepID=UPI001C2087DF|nr:myogenesis-regulating glycosidase-like isoform X2 [Aricia agestis]
MIRCLLITFFVSSALCQTSTNHALLDKEDVQLRLTDSAKGPGFSLVLSRNGTAIVIAVLGLRVGNPIDIKLKDDVELYFNNNITLKITYTHVQESRGFDVSVVWTAPADVRLEDCVNLGLDHWYGGPQQKRQFWPIEKLVLHEYSYITKEADNCGIAEPYWLSSSGVFYYFDRKVPLFVDQNVKEHQAACFIAQVKSPYSSNREQNSLAYNIGIFDDARQAHQYAIAAHLNKPGGMPDERMITNPIWSTWARYKRNINHDVVLKFADEINSYGFPNSQIEIDDLWEVCYGSLTVDERRFPNMKDTVDKLKEKGFRVTLWVHPFINKGCEPWYSEAKENGYLVVSEAGSVETSWWNDNGTTTSHLDFTKPLVQKWYTERLRALQTAYGIDSFKFDAGESSWTPQIPVLQGDKANHPTVITEDYVRTVAQFGPLVEVRSGYRTQDLPVFVRMLDKDSYWSFENGLPTLLTTALQMTLSGYPLVLPDMVGGNGYNEPPSKELFIRWLQATVFMPGLQFSYVPWDFDNETIKISQSMVQVRQKYSTVLTGAAASGAPVVAPVWWADPNDREAQGIWDEYLVGDILVAPVLTEGAVSRDVYLPRGRWRVTETSLVLDSGWHRELPAPLDTLMYFVRETL